MHHSQPLVFLFPFPDNSYLYDAFFSSNNLQDEYSVIQWKTHCAGVWVKRPGFRPGWVIVLSLWTKHCTFGVPLSPPEYNK